ncbi:MAG: hypothetical protein IKY94_15925 [Lachnospiraceae bacterium]|nr:hypothetical protein [Lachnospiraceae bacterium]
MGVGTAGDYLICYCGIIERTNPTKTTECYNKSLTKVAVASANIAKSNVNSASPNKQFACFFHGKVKGDNKQLNEVEVYDSSLTKYFLSNTNSGRMASYVGHNGKNCATMAGNYIILAGGCVTGEGGLSILLSSTAEVYKYNS